MGRFEAENLELKEKFKELRKKSRKEVNKAIEDFWGKWAIRIGGGFFIFGIAVGRFG